MCWCRASTEEKGGGRGGVGPVEAPGRPTSLSPSLSLSHLFDRVHRQLERVHLGRRAAELLRRKRQAGGARGAAGAAWRGEAQWGRQILVRRGLGARACAGELGSRQRAKRKPLGLFPPLEPHAPLDSATATGSSALALLPRSVPAVSLSESESTEKSSRKSSSGAATFGLRRAPQRVRAAPQRHTAAHCCAVAHPASAMGLRANDEVSSCALSAISGVETSGLPRPDMPLSAAPTRLLIAPAARSRKAGALRL